MKSRIATLFFISLLALSALSACSRHNSDDRFEQIDDMVEDATEHQEESLEQNIRSSLLPSADPSGSVQNTAPQLTKEDAQEIALAHAGLTADAVSYLRTEYNYDDGRPEYHVEFYHDRWEYDYEIHAESGKILSYDRDR